MTGPLEELLAAALVNVTGEAKAKAEAAGDDAIAALSQRLAEEIDRHDALAAKVQLIQEDIRSIRKEPKHCMACVDQPMAERITRLEALVEGQRHALASVSKQVDLVEEASNADSGGCCWGCECPRCTAVALTEEELAKHTDHFKAR